ncbi:MAG: sensor domain-containing diguanylate cyclase [Thiogranum sp.]|nr:sensor domain-containing diguanylate cyclase [Thiogranum sp.]
MKQGAELKEFHWLMNMIQTIDVGLVVLDRDYSVRVWNGFMANHSGRSPHDVIGKKLFDLFDDIPEKWFRHKAESVFLLKNRAFTTWEQRPWLFRFRNYRPITGTAEFMYQNITLIPLMSVDGSVKQIGIIIYDVTDMAVGKIQLEQVNSQLESLSRTDRLTELNNRGYWEECLITEFQRVHRTGVPCTLVMFDIDHFKKVNDTYGHQAGDEVIRTTARLLRECKRTTDIAGRYGGEEFGVMLIDTNAEGGRLFAERLREKVAAHAVNHEGRRIAWTISLGIAECGEQMRDHQQWIECSDRALYEAKESGRNRSVIYSG